MVVGVVIFNWWFEHMGSIFLVLGIILMLFLGKNESFTIKVFMQGVSDFPGFAIILGFF